MQFSQIRVKKSSAGCGLSLVSLSTYGSEDEQSQDFHLYREWRSLTATMKFNVI